jgi:hypothetical protein
VAAATPAEPAAAAPAQPATPSSPTDQLQKGTEDVGKKLKGLLGN